MGCIGMQLANKHYHIDFCTLLSLILLFIMLVTLLSLTTCVRIVGDRNIFPENQIVLR